MDKIMNRILTIALVAFALVSCNKTELPGGEPTDNMVNMFLVPTTDISVSGNSARFAATGPNTKPFLVNSGTGTNRSAIGVCIYPAGYPLNASTPYYVLPGYHNIRGTGVAPSSDPAPNSGYATSWRYLPHGAATTNAAYVTNAIGLSTTLTETSDEVDVYGYYPYMDDINRHNLTNYPFTVGTTDSTNYDFMYTGKITVNPTPAGTPDLYPPFQFKHAMTVLQFRMQTSFTGPIRVDHIKLKAVDKATGLVPASIFAKSGFVNLVTGALTIDPSPANYSSELSIDFKKTITRKSPTSTFVDPTSCCFVFPEITGRSDVKIVVDIVFSDPNDPSGQRILIAPENTTNPVEIDLSGTSFGGDLRKDYRYIFNMMLDNYIKYTNPDGSFAGGALTIDPVWVDVNVPIIEI